MAETPSKRLRQEETLDADESSSKRQKPYSTILSLLDEEEESHDLNQDLSAIFTTLEQELSADFDFASPPPAVEDRHQTAGEQDDGAKSVMRHLLEASDDELGIPNCSEEISNAGADSGEGISVNLFDNGLWEFDDVSANYYTIMQSELFL